MRLSSLSRRPGSGESASNTRLWQHILLLSILPFTQAVSLTPAPPTNLDLTSLGHIVLPGDFDDIALYQYLQQSEGSSNNGSQSVVASLGSGIFVDTATSDASISAMCPFMMSSGEIAGIVVGGNFTSLGGVDAQAVAMFNPTSGQVTPLPGIYGQVSALLCDQETNSVYVGGSFKAANSTNAIAWVGTSGWANLAFAGFNGPVSSITKAPSGHIVFGGSFSGLGNATTPTEQDEQVINLSSADITSGSTTTTTGFDNPSSIICATNGTDGAGTTWLVADNQPGYWQANMQFGYEPTKLRLWNTNEQGRGTKTFRVTALPLNGIMNLTYTDPSTGTEGSCSSQCPLSHNASNPYQDFHFVNVVGMAGIRIDISDWYGDGAGLDGIELFENDIFAYAVNDFNEPTCAKEAFGSAATSTGAWAVTPSGQSEGEYLTAVVDSANASSVSVTFQPDIKQAGNYSVAVYTPGCIQTNSCASRGIVTVNATFAATGAQANKVQTTQIYQTNDFDKYDQIWMGYVDAASDSFRPAVTLTPAAGSNNIEVVAFRVRFQLIDSTGGLNGMYDFNPNQAVASTDFSASAINRAGTDLDEGASVNALVTSGDTIYAAGKFSDDVFENIMAFSNNSTQSLPDGGLNAAVSSMFSSGDMLYLGGNFTNTSKPSMAGLNNIAAFSTSKNQWIALGEGVNGPVNSVVPLEVNVSSSTPETTITFSGDFTQISAFRSNPAIAVDGFAIWVPSKNNWLQNISGPKMAFAGQLSAYANVSFSAPLLAGTLSSQGMAVSGAISLAGSSTQSLNSLPINIQPNQAQSSIAKRATTSSNKINGVVTGIFYDNGGRNVTVLGGHFSATATNDSAIHNVLFLNGSNNDAVTGFASGVDTNATIYALAVQEDTLFAGGLVTGKVSGSTINGLVLYDLVGAEYKGTQPPALSGDNVVVNTISVRPSSTDVYVGGDFTTAGSLGCATVCMFSTATGQWVRPGTGLSGVVTAFTWSSATSLIAAGNLSINGNSTAVASYNTKKKTWSSSTPLSDVPGPVTAMAPGNSDASNLWISGKADNGSTYLINFNDNAQSAVGNIFGSATDIRGLQVLELSKSHESTPFLDNDRVLLLTGQLELPDFGNASAALFNGTHFQPWVLSTSSSGEAGSLSQLISSNTNVLKSPHKHHSTGIVILVALCAALGCLFLIILISLIVERVHRRRQGYTSIPSSYTDKHSNLGRVPPEHLFQSLNRGGGSPPPMV